MRGSGSATISGSGLKLGYGRWREARSAASVWLRPDNPGISSRRIAVEHEHRQRRRRVPLAYRLREFAALEEPQCLRRSKRIGQHQRVGRQRHRVQHVASRAWTATRAGRVSTTAPATRKESPKRCIRSMKNSHRHFTPKTTSSISRASRYVISPSAARSPASAKPLPSSMSPRREKATRSRAMHRRLRSLL